VLETVSRGFGRLQDEGVIEVRGRRVRILDQAALAVLASGGEPTVPHSHRQGRS
jgi:CRP/FNR family transcriptional regulator